MTRSTNGNELHDEFIFCEGCGARLDSSDRVCPKCGRPAPGILSTSSSSSDLAAGRTASFPRLTDKDIAEAPSPSAPELISRSLDPMSTGVLSFDELSAAGIEQPSQAEEKTAAERKREKQLHHDAARGKSSRNGLPIDDYSRPRRFRWVAPVAVLLLALGAVWFVTKDPLGVMPGFYDSFSDAAGKMFPSRQLPEGGQGAAAASDSQPADPAPSGQDVFSRLEAIYQRIVEQHEALDGIIADYNTGFESPSLDTRQRCSRSAYDARDALDSCLEELDGLQLSKDSEYAQDAEKLKTLAGLVRTRIDMYCASWDISLSYSGSDRPVNHEREILAPLRDRKEQDAQAASDYYKYVEAWKPVEK